MRFPIRIDPIWRPMLLAGGATRGRSYVEVKDDDVSFNFGVFSRQSVQRSEIVSVAPRQWPGWYGVGWRSNLRGVIGLIGSYQGVVEVKLRRRTRAWAVFPCDRIAVSLEDPAAFIAALSGAPVASQPRAEPAKAAAPAKKAAVKAATAKKSAPEKAPSKKSPAIKAATNSRAKS